MKSLTKSYMWMGVALLATAMVGVTAAAEDPSDNLQGSWNDYPAKWIQGSAPPTVTPSYPNVPIPPTTNFPPEQPQTPIPPLQIVPPQTPPGGYPPGLIPPRQQQQGTPSGGGFAWKGGKTGKQGGSFNWGRTKPPQSQQGPVPWGGQANPGPSQANPDMDKLLAYLRMLEAQNAQLRALLERLAGQQGMNTERSPDLPNGGVPLD